MNFFHMGSIFGFLPAILMSSTYTDKNNPCFWWTNRYSELGTFPIQVPTELCQNVFPSKGLQVGDHVDFFQEEPLDLQCVTMILATCVEVDVSIYLDILTLEFWANLERLPFLLVCKRILGLLLVVHNEVILQWHPSLWLLSFVTQTSLALWIHHESLNRLSQCHSEYNPAFVLVKLRLRILIFEITDVHQRLKMACSHFVFREKSPFCSELLPLFVHCSCRLRNFHCMRHRNKLVPEIVMTYRIVPFLRDVIFMIFW